MTKWFGVTTMPGVYRGPMVVVIKICPKVVEEPTWDELEWEDEDEFETHHRHSGEDEGL